MTGDEEEHDASAGEDEDQRLRSRGDLGRARKAEETRLAALAAALADLSKKQLARLDLDDAIVDAVEEARRMTTHSARARQLRAVRRELRGSDSVAIAAAVADLLNPRGSPSPAARKAAAWAERFLAEGRVAVEAFLLEHEEADRQHLNVLIRNAQKAGPAKAAKAKKALVTSVRALLERPRE